MIRIGVDNGRDGAIVALGSGFKPVLAEVMPTNGPKKVLDMVRLWAIMERIKALDSDLYAVLEYAQVMPKQGAVSGMTTGLGYGAVQMALTAAGIPYEIMQPRRWQKAVGVRGRGSTKEARRADIKMQVIQVVQRRVPQLNLTPGTKRKPHDGLADACGMALVAALQRPSFRVARVIPAPPVKKSRR